MERAVLSAPIGVTSSGGAGAAFVRHRMDDIERSATITVRHARKNTARMPSPAPIVILNGPPRSGKSSIVAAMQEGVDRPWMNLGVDVYARHITPPGWQPGIGLRPGEDRPELQALIPTFYAALYDSIAAHSRLGLAVVADLGHHVADPDGLALLKYCARRVSGLPVLFVCVHAPLDIVIERRRDAPPRRRAGPMWRRPKANRRRRRSSAGRRRRARPGLFDMEIDTSITSAAEAVELILERLLDPPSGPTAFDRLAPEDGVEPG
jgi:chloramphenicol 3-O phosphotransferase